VDFTHGSVRSQLWSAYMLFLLIESTRLYRVATFLLKVDEIKGKIK